MQFRKMLATDLSEVMAIEKEIYKNPWSLESYQEALNSDSYDLIVLEDEGKIIGYFLLIVAQDDASIGKVSVAKALQGKGYGAKLMDEIIRIAVSKKCAYITLEVRVHNRVAHSLYVKYGFTNLATRKRYYDDDEDAIVMFKDLKGAKACAN